MVKRVQELETLESDFLKPISSYITLFGRKQVGKTTLLHQYIQTKPTLFFSCIEILPKLLFESFAQELALKYPLTSSKVDCFEDFLLLLSQVNFEQKTVIVLDDFHTMAKIQQEPWQLFFKYWNTKLKYKNIQIILSSSIHSSLKEDLRVFENATKTIKLQSFKYGIIKELLPDISQQDQLRVFALFGTNLQYIQHYNPFKEFSLNVKEIFLKQHNQIKNEGLILIKNELSETATYASILYAIAKGHHKIGEIAEVLNVKSSYLTRYIQKLIDMMIIRKIIPINEKGNSSKFGRYVFEDNYMKFWFSYLYFNGALLEEHSINRLLQSFQKEFEEVCVYEAFKTSMSELISNNFEEFFGYKPIEVGSWWNNKNKQIDLVGYDSSTITFIELRYKASQDVKQIYEELKVKSQSFETVLNQKFVIFSSH